MGVLEQTVLLTEALLLLTTGFHQPRSPPSLRVQVRLVERNS